MDVRPFEAGHVDECQALAQRSYAAACARMRTLPERAVVPRLDGLAYTGLGVVALDGGRPVGLLAGVAPFEGLFGDVLGTFAPLGACVVDERLPDHERRVVLTRLYQAAAERWVVAGALSHAIVVYADDRPVVDALIRSGFGLRTIDAIRTTEPLDPAPAPLGRGLRATEIPVTDAQRVLPLCRGLTAHLRASPSLMAVKDLTADEFVRRLEERRSRLFGIEHGADLVGYLEVADRGETFVSGEAGVANIVGAFLAPELRGRGLADALLDVVIATLRAEGATHLGVDYEAFNPAASGFWPKHFTEYSFGLTRRMDERLARLMRAATP